MDEEYMWRQLGYAIELRSAQDKVLWSIFGVFWAANAILLVALFPKGGPPASLIGIIVSAVGILLSGVWYLIQGRALGHVDRYEELINRLETDIGLGSKYPGKYAVSGKINAADYEKCVGKGTRARAIMPKCALTAGIIWAVAFIIFLAWLVAKLAYGHGLLKMLFS